MDQSHGRENRLKLVSLSPPNMVVDSSKFYLHGNAREQATNEKNQSMQATKDASQPIKSIVKLNHIEMDKGLPCFENPFARSGG